MKKNIKIALMLAVAGAGAYFYMNQRKRVDTSALPEVYTAASGSGWDQVFKSLDGWLDPSEQQSMSASDKWAEVQKWAPGVTRADWNSYQSGAAVTDDPHGYTAQDLMLIQQVVDE